MKEKKKSLSIILAVVFALLFSTLNVSAEMQSQAEETAWIIWETDAPVQRLAWDGSSLWTGAYRGGLAQWQLAAGQLAAYTTADGLSGNHVTGIAVDESGQKWLALFDGSLNTTTQGGAFADLTPAGAAGENVWDVAASGNEIWLASLGGGVSQYRNGSWTTYTKANSALPHDDIYAVAVDQNGTPWVGTVNYGVAALQGANWVSYQLPIEIEDPVSTGRLMPNQAVTDIAVDTAGNKWFATDGSGVAVLDASNTSWSVYNTSNSALSSNFIQSIHIDETGNLWFGTLNGGVNRLSADGNWTKYTTANSPLPEDDILDIATDAQGGLWLAAYDSGLAYYGSLPASLPTLGLPLFDKPDYQPGHSKGYYLWVDPATYEWTLAWSGDGTPHTFTGEIIADAPLGLLGSTGLEENDLVQVNGNILSINATESDGEDTITFKPSLDATELTIRLKIDGAYYPYRVHVGGLGETPGTAPFKIDAVQPAPPQLTLPENMTVEEGDYLYLSADLEDPDSPLDHIVSWDLGDGTQLNNTLSASHIYQDDGTYLVEITATDIHGRVGTDTMEIIVQNVAPDADFYYQPFAPKLRQAITFTGYFYDLGKVDTHTIAWDFGDGSDLLTTEDLEVTHTYEQTGFYEVTMTVADDDGGQDIVITTLEVINEPPQFALPESITVDEGVSLNQIIPLTDPDSLLWQVDIDYGDGSAVESYTLDTEGDFTLNYAYADNGIYSLSLTITDDVDASTTAEMQVTVENVVPSIEHEAEITLTEGDTLTEIITIQDTGEDTWSVVIDYGDGSSSTTQELTERNFELSHTYVDNGSYTVEICVADDDGAEGCYSFVAQVLNANPQVNAGDDHAIEEGDTISVTAEYSDASSLDAHTASIDWGDGNVENITITTPDTVAAMHTYKNDGEFIVQVCVVDNDGGEGCDDAIVSVSNVAPVFEAGTDQSVDEGTNVALLDGNFADPGTEDIHTATIDWGDGVVEDASVTYSNEGAGVVTASHQYGDDGNFTVLVELCDDDLCVDDSFIVYVSNVSANVSVMVDAIAEGEVASARVEYSDPGFLDTHTATLNWDDGSELETIDVSGNTGSGSFVAEHLYVDNGDYEVAVTVTDDDEEITTSVTNLNVSNQAPVVSIDAESVVFAGEPFTLSGLYSDPGIFDTHTAAVNWGDGSLTDPATLDESTKTVINEHVFANPGTYTVTLTVVDNDGSAGEAVHNLTVLHSFTKLCLYGQKDLHIHDEATVNCSVGASENVDIKKGVVIEGFVISVERKITLHESVLVTGNVVAADDINLDKYVQVLGDVISGDKINVKEHVYVAGNVFASKKVKTSKDVVIDGTVFEKQPAPVIAPISLVNISVKAGDEDIKIKKNRTLTLPPGDYGKLEVEEGATLLLSAGEYTFEKIEVKKNAVLDLDIGSSTIAISVKKDISLKDNAQVRTSGSASNILWLVSDGDVKLHKDGTYLGTFIAPSGKLELSENAVLMGALYGKLIDVKKKAIIEAAPAIDLTMVMFPSGQ